MQDGETSTQDSARRPKFRGSTVVGFVGVYKKQTQRKVKFILGCFLSFSSSFYFFLRNLLAFISSYSSAFAHSAFSFIFFSFPVSFTVPFPLSPPLSISSTPNSESLLFFSSKLYCRFFFSSIPPPPPPFSSPPHLLLFSILLSLTTKLALLMTSVVAKLNYSVEFLSQKGKSYP